MYNQNSIEIKQNEGEKKIIIFAIITKEGAIIVANHINEQIFFWFLNQNKTAAQNFNLFFIQKNYFFASKQPLQLKDYARKFDVMKHAQGQVLDAKQLMLQLKVQRHWLHEYNEKKVQINICEPTQNKEIMKSNSCRKIHFCSE